MVINPSVGGRAWFDFESREKLISMGYEAAMEKLASFVGVPSRPAVLEQVITSLAVLIQRFTLPEGSLYHTNRKMELEPVGIDCHSRVDFLDLDAKHWQQRIHGRVSTSGVSVACRLWKESSGGWMDFDKEVELDTLAPLSPRIRKDTPCPSRSNVIRILGDEGPGVRGNRSCVDTDCALHFRSARPLIPSPSPPQSRGRREPEMK